VESKKSEKEAEPRLAPPGAGLPLVQRIFLRLIVGPILTKLPPEKEVRATYEKLTLKILKIAESIPSELRSKKVLVRPLPGIEDSSRYWSINDVLEHLWIVSSGITDLILKLSEGKAPTEEVNIARVKPGQKAAPDELLRFKEFAPELMARLDQDLLAPGRNIRNTMAFHHPWFGKFRARQWYWLLAAHQGIHYRQVKEIARALS
jgi:hypothetical protein